MLKTIAIVVAVLIAGVLILAAMKPDTLSVQRSTTIEASPEKEFALINDFKTWSAWSPWEKKDPAMKRTFSAIPPGKGAHYASEGNKAVGQGSMTLTESVPPSKIANNLDFIKPFEGRNVVEFDLAAHGDTTSVDWRMHGSANFMSKNMQGFINMDSMVGTDFEAGLANLKAVAEK